MNQMIPIVKALLGAGLLCSVATASAQDASRSFAPLDEFFEDESRLAESMPAQEQINADRMRMSVHEISLKGHDTPVRDQHATGLCTAFASIAAMENVIKRKYGVATDLSELHHWDNYWVYQTEAAVRAASRKAIADEVHFPFTSAMWRLKEDSIFERFPLNANLNTLAKAKITKTENITDQTKVLQHLKDGNPVVIGAEVNSSLQSLEAQRTGRISTAGTPEEVGHAMLIVGYRLNDGSTGGGSYILKNSWGRNSGDQGYYYLPFDYCGRGPGKYRCTFIAVTDVNVDGLSPVPSNPVVSVSASDFTLDAFNAPRGYVDLSITGKDGKNKHIERVVYGIEYDTFEGVEIEEIEVPRESDDPAYDFSHRIVRGSQRLVKAVLHLTSGQQLVILPTPPRPTPAPTPTPTVAHCDSSIFSTGLPAYCKRASKVGRTLGSCDPMTKPGLKQMDDAPVDCPAVPAIVHVPNRVLVANDFYVWTAIKRRGLKSPQEAVDPNEITGESIGVRIKRDAVSHVASVTLVLNGKRYAAKLVGDQDFVAETDRFDHRSALGQAIITTKNGQTITINEGGNTELDNPEWGLSF